MKEKRKKGKKGKNCLYFPQSVFVIQVAGGAEQLTSFFNNNNNNNNNNNYNNNNNNNNNTLFNEGNIIYWLPSSLQYGPP